MFINEELLESLDACTDGLKRFRRAYPRGLDMSGPPNDAEVERLARRCVRSGQNAGDFAWFADSVMGLRRLLPGTSADPRTAYAAVRYDARNNVVPRSRLPAWRARIRALWVLCAAS